MKQVLARTDKQKLLSFAIGWEYIDECDFLNDIIWL